MFAEFTLQKEFPDNFEEIEESIKHEIVVELEDYLSSQGVNIPPGCVEILKIYEDIAR
jgi:hypothetical protein